MLYVPKQTNEKIIKCRKITYCVSVALSWKDFGLVLSCHMKSTFVVEINCGNTQPALCVCGSTVTELLLVSVCVCVCLLVCCGTACGALSLYIGFVRSLGYCIPPHYELISDVFWCIHERYGNMKCHCLHIQLLKCLTKSIVWIF